MEEVKICRVCDIEKPLSDFSINQTRKDGHNSDCKKCKTEYNKRYYAENPDKKQIHKQKAKDNSKRYRKEVRKLISEKKRKGCSECGYNKCDASLHLHHIDPETKLINPTDMIRRRWSIKKVREELNKTKVLCANCHAEHHHCPVSTTG